MKDPYTFSTRQGDTEKGHHEEGLSAEGAPLKGPSEASVRKVLDFSKAYEVLDKGDGSEAIDLIRN